MAAIRIRIGTRKSVMALAQTAEIARRLAAAVPGIDVEIVKFETLAMSIRSASCCRTAARAAPSSPKSAKRCFQASCRPRCIR